MVFSTEKTGVVPDVVYYNPNMGVSLGVLQMWQYALAASIIY